MLSPKDTYKTSELIDGWKLSRKTKAQLAEEIVRLRGALGVAKATLQRIAEMQYDTLIDEAIIEAANGRFLVENAELGRLTRGKI